MEEPTAVNPRWRKSSYSDNGGTGCVEAGHAPGAVLIRDTKDEGTGPVLRVAPAGPRRLGPLHGSRSRQRDHQLATRNAAPSPRPAQHGDSGG
jgi:hypothetical protein